MDSRASTSAVQASPKPTLPPIDTTNHAQMVAKALTLSPSSPFATFRSSPLNPTPTPSPSSSDRPAFPQKRPSFPASRPLRPFPSVAQSMADTNSNGQDGPTPSGRRPQKTIEISSKWKGGFFVLGLTQAEFSRRD